MEQKIEQFKNHLINEEKADATVERDNADNKAKVVALLKKYKAKNVSTIPKDKYEDFFADLKSIAEGGD